MKHTQLLAVFAATFLFAACGGSDGEGNKVDNKDSAAGAAYDVKEKGEGLHARSGRGLSPAQVPDVPGIGDGEISTEHSVTVQGKTGRAILNYKTDITSGEVSVEYTITYEGFSDDELETYDGTITHRVLVNEGQVETQVSGTIDVSGKTVASLEMDVYVKVTSGSIELRGFVTADGVRYDYNGDIVDLDAID